jgi:hypothetical protein
MGNDWPVVIAVLAGLAILLGSLLISQEQQLRCINTLKDKPAAEIRVVCK